jgi:hypothetical protein
MCKLIVFIVNGFPKSLKKKERNPNAAMNYIFFLFSSFHSREQKRNEAIENGYWSKALSNRINNYLLFGKFKIHFHVTT